MSPTFIFVSADMSVRFRRRQIGRCDSALGVLCCSARFRSSNDIAHVCCGTSRRHSAGMKTLNDVRVSLVCLLTSCAGGCPSAPCDRDL